MIPPDNKEIFSFEITTTALCNLECSYCFEGEKIDKTKLNDTEEKVNNIISNILTLSKTEYFSNRFNEILITFWGGEPTLNQKFIIDIMDKLKDKETDSMKFSYMIYTNGYKYKLIEEILEFMKTTNILSKLNLQISYDGKIINDKYRLTKSKESSRDQVLSNFFKIARTYSVGQLHLKATIPLDMTDTIFENWKEFYQFRLLLSQMDIKALNIGVEYSPTLDYINLLPSQTKEALAKDFENRITEIAKLEYDYYLTYGRHLMTWFSGKEMRNNCSAGSNLINLNVDGSINYCHGSLYTKFKNDLRLDDKCFNELKFTNLLSNDDIERINEFIRYFEKQSQNYYRFNTGCIGCEATYCTVCPAMLYSLNKQKYNYPTMEENLYHNNEEFLNCKFFKVFGKVDRALQKLINERKNNGG